MNQSLIHPLADVQYAAKISQISKAQRLLGYMSTQCIGEEIALGMSWYIGQAAD